MAICFFSLSLIKKLTSKCSSKKKALFFISNMIHNQKDLIEIRNMLDYLTVQKKRF